MNRTILGLLPGLWAVPHHQDLPGLYPSSAAFCFWTREALPFTVTLQNLFLGNLLGGRFSAAVILTSLSYYCISLRCTSSDAPGRSLALESTQHCGKHTRTYTATHHGQAGGFATTPLHPLPPALPYTTPRLPHCRLPLFTTLTPIVFAGHVLDNPFTHAFLLFTLRTFVAGISGSGSSWRLLPAIPRYTLLLPTALTHPFAFCFRRRA